MDNDLQSTHESWTKSSINEYLPLISMNILEEWNTYQTRRQLLARGKNVLGGAALSSLIGDAMLGNASANSAIGATGPHFAPKAKRVIYLHMVGGPSQMDLFDYKPGMQKWYDKDLPASIRNGQRLTTMTSGQARFPIAPSKFNFAQYGQMRHVDEL
jgi:hypothetical protein